MDQTKKTKIDEIARAINALFSIAPEQADFVEFSKTLLRRELDKGGKITALKRIHKEILVYAKNVLSREKFKEFELTSMGDKEEDGILGQVIAAGKIQSDEEFRAVMDELNSLIQEAIDPSVSEKIKIACKNELLAAYEKKEEMIERQGSQTMGDVPGHPADATSKCHLE